MNATLNRPFFPRLTRNHVWYIADPGISNHFATRMPRADIGTESALPTSLRPPVCDGGSAPYGQSLGLAVRDIRSFTATAVVANLGGSTLFQIVPEVGPILLRAPRLFNNTLAGLSLTSARVLAKISDTDLLLEAYTPFFLDPILVIRRLNAAASTYGYTTVTQREDCLVPIKVSSYVISPTGTTMLVSETPNSRSSTLHLLRLIDLRSGFISDPISRTGHWLYVTTNDTMSLKERNVNFPALFTASDSAIFIYARIEASELEGLFRIDVNLKNASYLQRCSGFAMSDLSAAFGKSPAGERIALSGLALSAPSVCLISFSSESENINSSTQPLEALTDLSQFRWFTLNDGSILGFTFSGAIAPMVIANATNTAAIFQSESMFATRAAIPLGASGFLLLNQTSTGIDIVQCIGAFHCFVAAADVCVGGESCAAPKFLAFTNASAVIRFQALVSSVIYVFSTRQVRSTGLFPLQIKHIEPLTPYPALSAQLDVFRSIIIMPP